MVHFAFFIPYLGYKSVKNINKFCIFFEYL